MNQASLNSHIFISPPLNFDMKWKGWDKLFLELKDSLLTNQTYVVSIGSGVSDLHRNRMKASYQFAFSTGTVIDSGAVTGRVFGLKKNVPLFIFAYLLTDSSPFSPDRDKPLYISQPGAQGRFALNYLKTGCYRLLAVEDQNHNLLADTDYERVGMGFSDVCLDSAHIAYQGLNLQMTTIDTTAPQVLSIRSRWRTVLQVRMSEGVLPQPDSAFMLRDSLSGKKIPLLGLSVDPKVAHSIDLFTEPLDSVRRFLLTLPALSDSAGNINDTLPVFTFRASAQKDTTAFRLLEHRPADSAQALPCNQTITLKFSEPVDTLALKQGYTLVSAGRHTLAGRWQFSGLFKAHFIPQPVLQPDSSYFSLLDMKRVKNLWGKVLADSLDRHYFTIVSARELGEISGRAVVPPGFKAPLYLTVKSLKKKTLPLELKVPSDYKFYLPFLPQGKYLLNGFVDLNKDGRYNTGKLFPFSFSEPFYFFPDTVNVRKRWETSGVRFVIPGLEKK